MKNILLILSLLLFSCGSYVYDNMPNTRIINKIEKSDLEEYKFKITINGFNTHLILYTDINYTVGDTIKIVKDTRINND